MFSVILIGVIIITTGSLVYISVNPGLIEKFTEFYILGPYGKAAEYVHEAKAGEELEVTVGIINREGKAQTYNIEIRIDGSRNSQIGPVELRHNAKWEGTVAFTPHNAGEDRKVEFLLYKNGEIQPYLVLYQWINVTD